MKNKIIIFIILAMIPFTLGFWQRYNKATGKDDLIFISTEKEKKIGASIARKVEKKFDGVDDPLIQQRVEALGKRLAEVADRQELIYRFKVLKSEDEKSGYNAFALPGGYVYIFDKLEELLETDDNIAAVLAHEMGHINAKHSIKRLQSSLGMTALMILAMGTAQKGRDVQKAHYALGQLMMAYSRADEFEADKLSVRYMKRAGFDPRGVIGALEKLKELRKKGPIRRYTEFKTHPYLSERIARTRSEVSGKLDFNSYINLPDSSREEF